MSQLGQTLFNTIPTSEATSAEDVRMKKELSSLQKNIQRQILNLEYKKEKAVLEEAFLEAA